MQQAKIDTCGQQSAEFPTNKCCFFPLFSFNPRNPSLAPRGELTSYHEQIAINNNPTLSLHPWSQTNFYSFSFSNSLSSRLMDLPPIPGCRTAVPASTEDKHSCSVPEFTATQGSLTSLFNQFDKHVDEYEPVIFPFVFLLREKEGGCARVQRIAEIQQTTEVNIVALGLCWNSEPICTLQKW